MGAGDGADFPNVRREIDLSFYIMINEEFWFFHSVGETIENKIAGGEHNVTLKSRSAAHGCRDGGRTHLAHSAFVCALFSRFFRCATKRFGVGFPRAEGNGNTKLCEQRTFCCCPVSMVSYR